ncbi:MAG: MFS transporter [Streptosporangiales bacterium]|nr:MFS transporter [Streptosporangiales bacterium]
MTVSGASARAARAARATGRFFARTGRGVAVAGRSVGRAARRATTASGAGRSGLANLIELSAVNSAGDALVAVALAGTLFFDVPVDEARGRVALYLLVTMAPFAVVAPFVGPALDRMRSGRRYAIAGTMALRGVLCWALAGAVIHQDVVTLFPAAFGVLVLNRAYGVSRSSTTPRLLPAEITLVTANARCSLAGLVAAALAAPVGFGLAQLTGPAWVLRIATIVFLFGAVLGVRLPRHADSPEVDPAGVEAEEGTGGAAMQSFRRMRELVRNMGPVVAEALRANIALRVFSGFLIFYLAFLLREARFTDIRPELVVTILAAAAGIGGFVGTGVGAWVRSRAPQFIVLATLALATGVAAAAAVLFGLAGAIAVAFVAALTHTLGKLAQDALIQREVPEEVRSSTFGLTETFQQVAWVVGGGVGLAVSLVPSGTFGLGLAAVGLGVTLVVLMVGRGRRLHRVRRSMGEHVASGAPPAAP